MTWYTVRESDDEGCEETSLNTRDRFMNAAVIRSFRFSSFITVNACRDFTK